MIEAVNSVIANANLSRGSAVQASVAAQPQREPAELPTAPFISPRVSFDSTSNKAVLQIRDSSTGDVVNQFPSESRLRALQAQQARENASSTRQAELTGANVTQAAPVPTQSFDAGAIAALQAPQGVSTSDVQLAAVAFTSGASSGAAQSATVNVTA